MSIVYLSLGSNIGDRKSIMETALAEIGEKVGTVFERSSLYRSSSWGFSSSDFLNRVIGVATPLSAHEVLAECLTIEKKLGRDRIVGAGYSDRTIDIDILFYENQIMDEEGLTIPHPHIQKRKFILIPMNEIAPDFLHPVLQKSISTLVSECVDEGSIERTTD